MKSILTRFKRYEMLIYNNSKKVLFSTPIICQFLMCNKNFEKKFIGITTIIVILFTIVCSSVLLSFLINFHLTQISKSLFVALIAFISVCALIFFVSIYCAISFGRIQKIFLIIMMSLFTIIIGCISFAVYTFEEDLLYTFGLVWKNGDQRGIEKLEKYFNCVGFNLDDKENTCSGKIDTYLLSKTKLGTIISGSFFIVFALAMFFAYYLMCMSSRQQESEQETKVFNEPKIEELDDIETPLNKEEINL